jgi:phenylpyruvate tautomerase PptA (4-oxalocrotonate tautomerase family)
MPLIQVTVSKGTLRKNEQDDLISRLSNAVLKSEGAPINDPGAQSLVWAYYHEVLDGAVYVGGKNLEKAPIRVDVTTPEGALNDVTRKSLVEEIGVIVDDIVGKFEGRLNHWAMLHELNEGGWAGGGQIFRLADIKGAMNIKAA